jgi:hypothetical protein
MTGTGRSGSRAIRTLIVSVMATLAIVSSSSPHAEEGPVVSVTGGQIRGVLLAPGGAVFKGIP